MRSKVYDYSKEELQKMLDESSSYGEVLDKIGLERKGKNPDTLKNAIAFFNLDETKLNENRKKKYAECAKETHKKIDATLPKILNKNSTYQGSKLLHKLYKRGLKSQNVKFVGLLIGIINHYHSNFIISMEII